MPAYTLGPNTSMYNVSSFILPTSKSVFFCLSSYGSFILSFALSFAVFSIEYTCMCSRVYLRVCVCACMLSHACEWQRIIERPIPIRELLEMRAPVDSKEKKEIRLFAKNNLKTKQSQRENTSLNLNLTPAKYNTSDLPLRRYYEMYVCRFSTVDQCQFSVQFNIKFPEPFTCQEGLFGHCQSVASICRITISVRVVNSNADFRSSSSCMLQRQCLKLWTGGVIRPIEISSYAVWCHFCYYYYYYYYYRCYYYYYYYYCTLTVRNNITTTNANKLERIQRKFVALCVSRL